MCAETKRAKVQSTADAAKEAAPGRSGGASAGMCFLMRCQSRTAEASPAWKAARAGGVQKLFKNKRQGSN